MIIGLTGSSGSGKSVASKYFEKLNHFVIDYDKLTYEVYTKGEPCLNELTQNFGNDIIDQNGNLMRKKLGEIVFANKEKLNLLNSIVMKHILAKSEILINQNKNKNIILDAPLLFEAGLDKICDKTIAVISDAEIQIKRIMERDGISYDTAKGRLDAQHTNDFFKANCDYCITNTGSEQELTASCQKIWEELYGNCK